MDRNEQIQRAAKEYDLWEAGQQLFIVGAEWADEHPREGLWDKEKVIKWLENNLAKETSVLYSGIININFNNVITQLCKAMEE